MLANTSDRTPARSRRWWCARPIEGGRTAKRVDVAAAHDVRGSISIEYLALVGAIALGIVALAVALRDAYADGFVQRSLVVLGVE